MPALQAGSPEFKPLPQNNNKNRATTAAYMVECLHNKGEVLRKTLVLPNKIQLVIKQYTQSTHNITYQVYNFYSTLIIQDLIRLVFIGFHSMRNFQCY
jgi:hypothetical protein